MGMAPEGKGRAIPAPVGGWNARDDWDDMDKKDAIDLLNWWPGTDSVESRRGYTSFSTGMTGQVEAVMEYEAGSTNQMLAAASDTVYNASTATAAALKTGFTSARWQYVNFDGKLGMVNGEDDPQEWDGTTLSDMTISGPGLTVSDLIDIEIYASRAWYVPKNSQDVWYSAIDTLGVYSQNSL